MDFDLNSTESLSNICSEISDLKLSGHEYYMQSGSRDNRKNTNNTLVLRSNKLYQLDSTSSISLKIDPSLSFVNEKRKYLYDNELKKDIYFLWACLNSGCQWEPFVFSVSEYNLSDNIKSLASTSWDGLSYDYNCDNIIREYIFNSEDKLDSLIVTRNNSISIATYLYNDEALLDSVLFFGKLPNQDSVGVGAKFIYNHNIFGQLESIVYSQISPDLTTFLPQDSTHFTYYPDGRIHHQHEFFPGAGFASWIDARLTVFNYNLDGYIDYEDYFYLYESVPNPYWRLKEKTVYNYHPSGSLTHISIFDNRDSTAPIEVIRREFKYDLSVESDKVQLPRNFTDDLPEGQQHMLLSEEQNIVSDGYEFLGDRSAHNFSYFYKSTVDVSTLEIQTLEDISCSPNPARDKVQINSSSNLGYINLKIYDSNGTLVSKCSLMDKEWIDISAWAPGLYFFFFFFFFFEAGGSTTIRKILKL